MTNETQNFKDEWEKQRNKINTIFNYEHKSRTETERSRNLIIYHLETKNIFQALKPLPPKSDNLSVFETFTLEDETKHANVRKRLRISASRIELEEAEENAKTEHEKKEEERFARIFFDFKNKPSYFET